MEKIIIWNCNKAFRKKHEHIFKYNADIYIISECEDPNTVKYSEEFYKNNRYKWIGDNKNSGLGIFTKTDYNINEIEYLQQNDLKYFLPVQLSLENLTIELHAIWACQANSPTFEYIGQIWKYLDRNLSRIKNKNTILAGDFNSNSRWDVWDRWWNHSDVVNMLKSKNIRSTYHNFYNEDYGKESINTFYLQKNQEKGYHIDYCFMTNELIDMVKNVEIMKYENWIKISDHVPLIISL
jgi:exonuclease III